MESLYGWIFTYNPYTKTWLATERDNYMSLFNASSVKDNYLFDKGLIVGSSDYKTLIDIIIRTAGHPEKLAGKVDVKVEKY